MVNDQKRQRTCVNCSKKMQQNMLIRIAREKSGHVTVDVNGKIAGRGAYVCSQECLEASLSSGRLGRALRIKIDTIDRTSILSGFRDMMCKG